MKLESQALGNVGEGGGGDARAEAPKKDTAAAGRSCQSDSSVPPDSLWLCP